MTPNLQERSGRVALPRAKVKAAAPALEVAEAPERRETRAELLRRAAAIVNVCIEDEYAVKRNKEGVNYER